MREVIQQIGSPQQRAGRPDALLLQQGRITGFADPYEMPAVSVTNSMSLVPIEVSLCIDPGYMVPYIHQDILCTVNLQHCCAAHNCEATESVFVRQERVLTDNTKAVVSHHHPQDLILNTAQMHDAFVLNGLRYHPNPSQIGLDQAIEVGAALEVDARKRATERASETQGRGRGGHARAQRLSHTVRRGSAQSMLAHTA